MNRFKRWCVMREGREALQSYMRLLDQGYENLPYAQLQKRHGKACVRWLLRNR